MHPERQVVRVVADELGDHLPVWFPTPIFDDDAQMPVSRALIQRLRAWNAIQDDLESSDISAVTAFYRVGVQLATELARELGPDYDVQILVAGASPGWRSVSQVG